MEYILKPEDFITETTPMYSDPEGDNPLTIKIVTLPNTGSLTYDGVPVTDEQTFLYPIDLTRKDLTYTTDESILVSHTDRIRFKASDVGSEMYSNIGTILFKIPRQFNPPTVEDNSELLNGKTYNFKIEDFTNNYNDVDGDPYLDVIITTLPEIGIIRHNGGDISIDKRLKISDVGELQYIFPDNYALYDGVLYEFEEDITDIILRYEAAGYILKSRDNGLLEFTKIGQTHITREEQGREVTIKGLCFDFKVSEDSEEDLLSNEAEFCLIPQGDINIPEPYDNQPPEVENLYFTIENGESIQFNTQQFLEVYEDIEQDDPFKFIIVSTPNAGSISGLTVGQEVNFSEVDSLQYGADPTITSSHIAEFEFQISDEESQEFSNIGKVIINVKEKVASPPTVGDMNKSLSENVYAFEELDFTNNFQDPDEDSFELTIIESLPQVGDIYYNNSKISRGFEFSLSNITDLEFRLPTNYEINPNGYCVFPDSIDNIIQEQSNNGFSLINREIGLLEFQKTEITQVPNDTDIYAFFDTTSMNYNDAVDASNTLVDWYLDYKNTNNLYEGNLYIIPVYYESWVDYNDIIKNGTGAGKDITSGGEATNVNAVKRSMDLNSDWQNIAILPPDFDDVGTDMNNPNWTAPTKVLVLAFVDESNPIYHDIRQTDGFSNQPTEHYYNDYKRFRDNLDDHWDFFRGVFYPIPPATGYNSGLAVVLQGFAAIEGGATYSAAEMENLGMIDVVERGYDVHLDITHNNYTGSNPQVANPYSPEANNLVPNTSYDLEGLKNFGWFGIYDKVQPASSVFTQGSFQDELSNFLQGSTSTNEEIKIVEGICREVSDICFNFKTSDDSELNLYSNIATFCFDFSTDNSPPIVDDNSAKLRLKSYSFSDLSFTKNFYDQDGDSYSRVTIKSLPEAGIIKSIGQPVSIGDTFPVISSNSITFELGDRYAVYNNILYQFNKSIDVIINDYKTLGYELVTNEAGKLTFAKTDNPNDTNVIQGAIVPNSRLCFNFTTSDDSQLKQESNVAKFCLIPEGNINVKEIEDNLPPIVGDNTVSTHYNEAYEFVRDSFIEDTDPRFSDPEGDSPYKLKILSLPDEGQLLYEGQPVSINDEFFFVNGIDNKKLTYVPNATRIDIESTMFRFAVSDTGSKIFVE